jgi:1-acyl-sn-glycerol-3-phosphate acyltransferase
MSSWFYKTAWSFSRSVFWVLFGQKPVDSDRVPIDGPVILASNHQSYFDPPMLATATKREMHFFAKKELFDMFILGPIIRNLNAFPVKRGVYDPAALSKVDAILNNDGALILFPEGTRGNGKTFLKPKPGIGMIAKKTRASVVPAYIDGTNDLGKALFWRKRIKIYFGQPIPPEQWERFSDDKAGYQELAEYVMEHIAQLKAKALATN